MDQKQDIKIQSQKDVQSIENELKEIEILIEQLQSRKKEIKENLFSKAKQSQLLFDENFKEIENNQKTLKEMCNDVATFCENEDDMYQELAELFKQKKFEEFDCFEISKCLWKMDLTKYQSLFETNQIDGSVISAMNDASYWRKLGLEKRDCLCALYNFEMMKSTGYWKNFSPNYEHDCCVCYHLTPEKTIHLLKE